MKNGIAWGVGAGALIMGLGVLGLSLRNPQGMQAAATPDPCASAAGQAQRPQNCSDSGHSSGAVYIPTSTRRSDDKRGGSGDGDEGSAGHAGFGESAGGHAGGGE
ncbi:MAG: hypothetical protein ABF727_09855 [Gluconobacter oxydans]